MHMIPLAISYES